MKFKPDMIKGNHFIKQNTLIFHCIIESHLYKLSIRNITVEVVDF